MYETNLKLSLKRSAMKGLREGVFCSQKIYIGKISDVDGDQLLPILLL